MGLLWSNGMALDRQLLRHLERHLLTLDDCPESLERLEEELSGLERTPLEEIQRTVRENLALLSPHLPLRNCVARSN